MAARGGAAPPWITAAAAGFAVGAAATAAAAVLYERRRAAAVASVAGAMAGPAAATRRGGVDGQVSSLTPAQRAACAPAPRPLVADYPTAECVDDDIVVEQLTRNLQLFGEEGQGRIRRSFVVVVGVGGVGSHAAHMLLRSGVGRLRLIDFDQVTLSSLNRHAVATRADVGLTKVDVLATHLARIFPEAHIEACNKMYEADTSDELLAGEPDYVLDCIDNIDTKVNLLAECVGRGLRVIASAGAGAKADPTRLALADITQTAIDPLARAVRTRLRRDHGITSGVQVLLSTERPCAALVDHTPEGSDAKDFQTVPGFRVRTIPVLGPLPALFGQAMAAIVLGRLSRRIDVLPAQCFRLDAEQFRVLYFELRDRERALADDYEAEPDCDIDEIAWLTRDVWRGLSARYNFGDKDKGQKVCARRARWDASRVVRSAREGAREPAHADRRAAFVLAGSVARHEDACTDALAARATFYPGQSRHAHQKGSRRARRFGARRGGPHQAHRARALRQGRALPRRSSVHVP